MKQHYLEYHYDINHIKKIALGRGLGIGSEDPSLTSVQNFLKRFNYLDANVHLRAGKLCELTMLGISRFQRSRGLGIRGVFDEETRSAMLQPRCALIDYPTAFTGRPKWSQSQLRYTFGDISNRPGLGIPPEVFQNSIRNAFNTWQNVGVGLAFSQVEKNEQPHFQVEWVQAQDPQDSYDLRGNIIAHAEFPPDDGAPPSRPNYIHFDYEEHKWADGMVESAYDIESVAVHEIGHAIGLLHSEVVESVMFREALTFSTKRRLHDTDIAALRSLYQPIPSKIALLACNGLYVQAENGGGVSNDSYRTGKLITARDQIDACEVFNQVNVGPNPRNPSTRIALQVHNGNYVCAEGGGGGSVHSARPWIRNWELFWTIPLGNQRIALQTFNDNFLRVGDDGRILATGDSVDERSTFLVVRLA